MFRYHNVHNQRTHTMLKLRIANESTTKLTINFFFPVFSFLLLGARLTGKSSLSIQFVQGQFVDSYDPTIENSK